MLCIRRTWLEPENMDIQDYDKGIAILVGYPLLVSRTGVCHQFDLASRADLRAGVAGDSSSFCVRLRVFTSVSGSSSAGEL